MLFGISSYDTWDQFVYEMILSISADILNEKYPEFTHVPYNGNIYQICKESQPIKMFYPDIEIEEREELPNTKDIYEWFRLRLQFVKASWLIDAQQYRSELGKIRRNQYDEPLRFLEKHLPDYYTKKSFDAYRNTKILKTYTTYKFTLTNVGRVTIDKGHATW